MTCVPGITDVDTTTTRTTDAVTSSVFTTDAVTSSASTTYDVTSSVSTTDVVTYSASTPDAVTSSVSTPDDVTSSASATYVVTSSASTTDVDASTPDVGLPGASTPDVGLPGASTPDVGLPGASIPDDGMAYATGSHATTNDEAGPDTTEDGTQRANGRFAGTLITGSYDDDTSTPLTHMDFHNTHISADTTDVHDGEDSTIEIEPTKPTYTFVGVKECPVLKHLPHSTLSMPGRRTGSVALYQCNHDYVFKEGGRIRSLICLETGQWHTEISDCVGEYIMEQLI